MADGTETNVGSIVAYLRLDSSDWSRNLREAKADAENLGRTNPTIKIAVDLATARADLERFRADLDRLGGARPDIRLGANSAAAVAKIKELQDQLKAIRDEQVTIRLDAATARADLVAFRAQMDALSQDNIQIRLDLTGALAQIEALKERLKNQGDRSGRDFGGAFNRSVQTSIREALHAIPKVTVDANTTPAQAKLQQVRASLDELSKKKIGIDIDAASAELRVANLKRELDRLTREAGNDIRLRVDTRDAAAALAKLNAELNATKAAASGESSASGGLGSGQLIFAAIAAGVTLTGPLVAAGTAGLIEFGGAAGVAALAYKGLQDDVKRGTATGLALQSNLHGITGELGQLETIAANRVGPGVISALSKVKAFLPELQGPVEQLGGDLGNALDTTATGLISGLRTAKPLLADAGTYAEHLAQSFADFTASPEFARFIDYARQELPKVGQDFADIASAGIHIATGLQPVGDALLSIIDDSAKAVTALSAVSKFTKNDPGGPKLGGTDPNVLQKTGNAIGHFFTADQSDPGGFKKKSASVKANDNALLQAGAASLASHQASLAAAEAAQKEQSALQGVADQYGLSVGAYQAATANETKLSAARQAAIATMKAESDAGGLLKDQLDKLSGKQLSAAQAQNQFEEALVSQAKATSKADAAVTGLSSSAIKNRGNLLNLVTSAESAAEAYGSLDRSGLKTHDRLVSLRKQIIDNAVANGENRDSVTKYIDSVLKIPPVAKTKVDLDNEAAQAKLAAFRAAVSQLPKSVQVAVSVNGLSTAEYQLQLLARQRTATITVQTVGGQGAAGVHSVGGVQVAEKHATGGDVVGPGTGTSDSVPFRNRTTGGEVDLSAGENVQTAASNRLNHAALQAANHGARLGVISGMAQALAAGGDIVSLTPAKKKATTGSTGSSSSGGSKSAGSKTTPYEYDGIYYSTAVAAANAKTRAEKKQVIDTISTTRGNGEASGFASYIRGQTPLVKTAAKELGAAVVLALSLKPVQKDLAKYKADLATVQQAQSSLRSSVGQSLSNFDPTQFGSITDLQSQLKARTGQNTNFDHELAVLRKKGSGLSQGLFAQFAAAGPSAGLDAVFNASAGQRAALSKQAALFNSSVRTGQNIAGSTYDAQISRDRARIKADQDRLDRTSTLIAHLAVAVGEITQRPVKIELDGKVVASTTFVNKKIQGALDALNGHLVTSGIGR